MFVVKGSTRTVRCFPSLGIVIKTPIECFGDFGVKANKAEAYLWKKTHNPLLAPVLFYFFGLVVMRYYPKVVRQGKHIKGGLPEEIREEQMRGTFFHITERILGAHIKTFVIDAHDIQGGNFRLTKEGRLHMVDYGISYEEDQKKFEEFLDKYGAKLAAEYSEPPMSKEYFYK